MSTKFDVMKVADELVNNFKTMLCEYTAVKFPEWAKDNNMTAYELSADTEGNGRFFGSMKESMAEDICCLLTHPDNESLQDGFILETDRVYNYRDGKSHGYIFNYRDGKSYIRTYGLAADVINSIEYILDDNNIDIPDEDRTGEDGEGNIYGKTYCMLLDQFSKKLAESLSEIKEGNYEVVIPEHLCNEYCNEKDLEER